MAGGESHAKREGKFELSKSQPNCYYLAVFARMCLICVVYRACHCVGRARKHGGFESQVKSTCLVCLDTATHSQSAEQQQRARAWACARCSQAARVARGALLSPRAFINDV